MSKDRGEWLVETSGKAEHFIIDNCNWVTTLMASTASKRRHSSIGQVILVTWVGNMFQELGVSNVQTALHTFS